MSHVVLESNLSYLKHATELIQYIIREPKNSFTTRGHQAEAIQRLTQIQLDTIKQTKQLIASVKA